MGNNFRFIISILHNICKKLLINYSSILVVGWSMTISGIIMNFKTPIWKLDISNINLSTVLYLSFGIIAGTAVAFLFFISSLKYLSAKETAFFGTIEPVMAILTSVIWLKINFLPFQLLGIAIIITLILLISFQKSKN